MTRHVVIAAAGVASLCLLAGEASARVSQYDQRGSDTCYVSTYVPNLVEENTRGRLLSGPRPFVSNGVGGRVSGGIVRVGVEPAVFYKSQRIVEREHYTLSPAACP